MDEATAAALDYTALRPLALKLAEVYKRSALQVKKTELMEWVGDTHGTRWRRKEDTLQKKGTPVRHADVETYSNY